MIQIPIEILSIRGDGFHCFVDTLINDSIPARMILDTGASRTVLDLGLIHQHGLTAGLESSEEKATGLGTNSMEGFGFMVKSIQIGELQIRDYLAGILDLSHVNTSYKMIGLPEIQGALGSDILHLYRASISYNTKTLKLSRRKKKG